jgi:glycosyltransferase involved in cell wall biosynthesis
MRILFIRFGLYPPEIFAGLELTLHWLCRSLIQRGHEVVVATNTKEAAPGTTTVDRKCGYRVYRSLDLNGSVYYGLSKFDPEVVVLTEAGLWMEALPPAVIEKPTVVYEHQTLLAVHEAPEVYRTRAVYIANSATTAEALKLACGISSTVVRPLFGIEQYAGIRRHGDAILFVSLQDRKGSDVAIRIAERRPDKKFVFVESWTQRPDRTEFLRNYISNLPNVTLLANQEGLTHIMPGIKLHLMPSRSRESWGRTATEAQLCGIPVLGSSRGNLPMTIGPGGVTLDPDEPIERWLEAFDRMMEDSVYYDALSQAALKHGNEFLPEVERAYDAFEQALHHAIQARRA